MHIVQPDLLSNPSTDTKSRNHCPELSGKVVNYPLCSGCILGIFMICTAYTKGIFFKYYIAASIP